jgi:predicted DCC family thiol-disulfide oxidoreductase YuxK
VIAVNATELTVLYDERCAFCVRCRDWLATQPVLVDVELVPAGSDRGQALVEGAAWVGKELVVLDDEGRAWTGPDAFLMCLWATARYRGWAFRFNGPHAGRFAERFFLHVSKRRGRYSQWLGPVDPECTYCDDVRVRRGL